jgi:hypothetical protein
VNFLLYLRRAATASTITPSFDAAWTNTTSATRHDLSGVVDGTDTINVGDARTFSAGEVRLDRQFFTAPLSGGITLTGVTVKCVIRISESNADDNITARMGLRVFNEAGTAVRHTLLAVANHGSVTEFATSAATRIFAAAVTVTGTYTTQIGDRIVLEVGGADASGTSPSFTGIYGTSAQEDQTYVDASTANFKPWISLTGVTGPGGPLLPSGSASLRPYTVSPYVVRPGCGC